MQGQRAFRCTALLARPPLLPSYPARKLTGPLADSA
jgi:hypothetical protein